MSETLRVLPLGGLGEIGKNMTVLEYDGAIVIVDVGLRFPTAEMIGIDLVLPDFAYLRDRVDDIEGIIITHGHEDHLGALPWILRELRTQEIPVFGGPLTMAMARSKLDEHRLRDVECTEVKPGDVIELGPFDAELVHMTHSIPDACAVVLDCPLGKTLITGDYKFDQTPVGGLPADVSRLAELGRDGGSCSAGTRRTPTARAGRRASRSSARACASSSGAARAGSWSRASPRTSTGSSRSSTPRRSTGARSASSAGR
jgi:ribonuclease J